MTKNERKAADWAISAFKEGDEGHATRILAGIVRASRARNIRSDLMAYAAEFNVGLAFDSGNLVPAGI